jgi:hypothetical protein
VGPHGVATGYQAEKHVAAADPMVDPMNKHGQLEAGTTQDAYGEFVVKIDVPSPWWVKVGRFTYSDPAHGWQMPILVGYEVDAPTGAPDVTVTSSSVRPVQGFGWLKTLTISGKPPGPHGEPRNGEYQIIRAN